MVQAHRWSNGMTAAFQVVCLGSTPSRCIEQSEMLTAKTQKKLTFSGPAGASYFFLLSNKKVYIFRILIAS